MTGRMPGNASDTRTRSATPRSARRVIGEVRGLAPARLRRHPLRIVCPRRLSRGERHRPHRRRGLSRTAPQTGGDHPRSDRPPGRTALLHRRRVCRTGPGRKPLHPPGPGRRHPGVEKPPRGREASIHGECLRIDIRRHTYF